MAASKKEIERFRLDQFQTFIQDFPSGKVECTEEPDFLVHGSDRIIGIELTVLYREAKPGQVPEQATESMRKRLVARAQEIYVNRGLPPVIVSFFLDDRIHIEKSEVEALANDLAELVADNTPALNSTIEVPKGWDDMRVLPRILHSLSIHRIDAVTKPFFNSPGATWVADLTRADIQRALSSKESKYSTYRRRCNEAWLVISADIEMMATWFEFDLEVLGEMFTTCFDRAFLVQHFGGKAYELLLRRDGA